MIADSNSNIAWHRVQLKKNREAVKALEIARFRVGEMTGAAGQAQQKALADLKRKIAESHAMHRRPRTAHQAAAGDRSAQPRASELGQLGRLQRIAAGVVAGVGDVSCDVSLERTCARSPLGLQSASPIASPRSQ